MWPHVTLYWMGALFPIVRGDLGLQRSLIVCSANSSQIIRYSRGFFLSNLIIEQVYCDSQFIASSWSVSGAIIVNYKAVVQ